MKNDSDIKLNDYFEQTEGTGVLATANHNGVVDAALYARCHVINEQTIALIMRNRLSYQNLLGNPNACYMFIEKGPGYRGKRFYLKKIREETDPKTIESYRRKPRDHSCSDTQDAYLVYFQIDHIRPLVGDA